MGEPKKIRKKYQPPRHPWEKSRIEEEKQLTQDFGFKNKREIWKVTSRLKRFKDRAKLLSAQSGAQAEIETQQLLTKLRSLNLLGAEQELQDILGVEAGSLADRRLQTLVFKKNLARSVKQARQMIVHKHITVNNQTITSPAYLVTVGEEVSIAFSSTSPFSQQDHPEIVVKEENLAIRPEEKEELEIKKEQDEKHPKKVKGNQTDTKKEKKIDSKEVKKEEKKEEKPKEAPKKAPNDVKEVKKEEIKEEPKKKAETEGKKAE